MSQHDTLERDLRKAFRARAATTTIHDVVPPRSPSIDPGAASPPGRATVWLGVAAALVALAAVAGGLIVLEHGPQASTTTGSGTPDDDGHPVENPSHDPTGGSLEGNDGDLMAVEGTSISIPSRIEGLDRPTVDPMPTTAAVAGSMVVVTFDAPGPMAGTIGGSFSLLIADDRAKRAQLAELEVGRDVGPLAESLGYDPASVTALVAGPYTVLKAAAVATIPGGQIGYDDRVYDEYVFVGQDDASVLQVTTDVLDENDVLRFISRIEA